MKIDPRRGDGRPVTPYVHYLLSNSWGLAIGALALMASLLFFILPPDLLGDPVVEAQLGEWARVYYVGYGVAGACMIGGICSRRPSLDAMGLCLLAAAVSIAFAALWAVLGLKALVSAPSTLALIVGSLGRVAVVARLVRPEPSRKRMSLEDFERTHGP